MARPRTTEVGGDPLYSWGARPYLPSLGAFAQLDTYPGSVADPLSLNRFLFTAANPWTFWDADGHVVTCGPDGQCAGRLAPAPVNPDQTVPAPNPPSAQPPSPPSPAPSAPVPTPSVTPPSLPSGTNPLTDSLNYINPFQAGGVFEDCDPAQLGLGLGLFWGGVGIDVLLAAAELASGGIATPMVVYGFAAGTAEAAHGFLLIGEACRVW